MTLELYNGIIVVEAATMLHDTDAIIAIINSAQKTKKSCKYCGTFYEKVLQYCIWYQVLTVPVMALKNTAVL